MLNDLTYDPIKSLKTQLTPVLKNYGYYGEYQFCTINPKSEN